MDLRPDGGIDLTGIRVDVLGTPVDAVTLPEAVAWADERIRGGKHGFICVTGVHGVMEATRRREVRQAHLDAGLVVPDGAPLAWSASRVSGRQLRSCRGSDLMRALLGLANDHKMRVGFYGSDQVTLASLVNRIRQRYPNIEIVLTIAPPFRRLSQLEMDREMADIAASRADLLFVGLSTPKQELWMRRIHNETDVPVLVGVGAAFDFLAGMKRECPRWLQHSGFEWLYRMLSEPRRLGPRYLRNNPEFLLRIALHRPVNYGQGTASMAATRRASA